MKFSIGIPGLSRYGPNFDPWMAELKPGDFQRLCRGLEAMGYDALESPEHLALDATLAPAMGGYWPHSIAAIAFYAGAVERARVNTRVTVLPLHHPVNLAKAIATLDVLTFGRVSLTVGVGHGEAEFRAFGIPYASRGRMADEYLQAMRILWTQERPEFHGEFVSFDGIAFEPKPVQRPFPPIWVGGNSKAAMRRALKFGVGWRPWLVDLEELPARQRALEAMPEAAARDRPLEFHMPVVPTRVNEKDHKPIDGGTGRPPELPAAELVDRIGRMQDLGVTWATLPHTAARSLEEYLDRMAAQAAAVIAPTRS